MNVNRLKGRIVERGLNISEVAQKMDIDRSSLYRKLNAKGETLTVREAQKLVDVLELDSGEAVAIFFENSVASNAN